VLTKQHLEMDPYFSFYPLPSSLSKFRSGGLWNLCSSPIKSNPLLYLDIRSMESGGELLPPLPFK
jgi:hypothetical protein